MIYFVQDACSNYQHRTFLNIELSELTLAFAVDFSTAGEKCTENYAKICEKPIFQFLVNEKGRLGIEETKKINEVINLIKEKKISIINIAGNGIYTFTKKGITQERINDLIYNVLKYIISFGCGIKKIRTGGQTGADEAGLVAGYRLGIETVSFCPKGWRFRDVNGNDIRDEQKYKARFKEYLDDEEI